MIVWRAKGAAGTSEASPVEASEASLVGEELVVVFVRDGNFV